MGNCCDNSRTILKLKNPKSVRRLSADVSNSGGKLVPKAYV